MSAHPVKAVTLSPELVLRFAAYLYRLEPGDCDPPIRDWGVFHASLKNHASPTIGHLGPAAPWGIEPRKMWHSDEEEALVVLFDQMTPSQRRRLGLRAEAVAFADIPAELLEPARNMVRVIDGVTQITTEGRRVIHGASTPRST